MPARANTSPQKPCVSLFVRASQINPKLLVYAQIHGPFDFNKTPLAPLGCKIVMHDRAEDRRSWGPHGTHGFYIGLALHHYRNYGCYIPSTRHTRAFNTVLFYPHCCALPLATPGDQLTMALQDLTNVLEKPIPPSLGVGPNHSIRQIQRILVDPTKNRVVLNLPDPATRKQQKMKHHQRNPVP